MHLFSMMEKQAIAHLSDLRLFPFIHNLESNIYAIIDYLKETIDQPGSSYLLLPSSCCAAQKPSKSLLNL